MRTRKREVTIVVAELAESDEGLCATTKVIRLFWNGSVVELEHFLARSKRVSDMSRSGVAYDTL